MPFGRLVQAVDEWAETNQPECEIFGQVLSPRQNPYVPRNFEITARLSPKDYTAVFRKAQLIISHAGMGTILTALTQAKCICVMPRQRKFGEHRNDHQIATVNHLREHPGLFKARDENDLPEQINAALRASEGGQTAAIDPFSDTGFTDKLRSFIMTGRT
ncbi:glycosyltransferase [Aestuariivita boseongensis]|uniref:glycosyltransferase n=1 Tax=Aestuariivita boseongensis TaxID=1470562 RepID=UPI002480E6D0|nr:glycosyltransferase [Aestuariivita boseongensis]